MLGRGGGDARQHKDFLRLSLIIVYYFALQDMSLNFKERETCSVAKALLDIHVAQQHIDSSNLEV